LPLLLPFSAAKNPPAFDPGYAEALATADHFLHAWQTGDLENGMVLLTTRAKEKANHDALEAYFSGSGPQAYEIARGRMVRPGRYAFPVVLVNAAPGSKHPRRRFSEIVILNTGHNDWAVDKLP
jgi:hypothetical protein